MPQPATPPSLKIAFGCLLASLIVAAALVVLWQGGKYMVAKSEQARDETCAALSRPFNHGPVRAQGYRRVAGEFASRLSPSLDIVVKELVEKRFRFVEIDIPDHFDYRMKPFLPEGTTAVRYRLGVRGEPACAYYADRFADYWPLRRAARASGLPDSLCVAIEPADPTVSTHVIESTSPDLEPGKSTPWWQVSLRDTATGKEVARYRGYSIGNSRYTTYNCGDFRNFWRLVDHTILPSEEGDALDRMGLPADSPVREFYRVGPLPIRDRTDQPLPAPVQVDSSPIEDGWMQPASVDYFEDRGSFSGPTPGWDFALAEVDSCAKGGCVLHLSLPAGRVRAPLPGASAVSFVEVQEDGRVLAVGRAIGGDDRLRIYTYAVDGTLREHVETAAIVPCDQAQAATHLVDAADSPAGFTLTYATRVGNEAPVSCSYFVPRVASP